MKYNCTVISVADIKAARKFYEDLFGLEVFQDYGRNIAFTCGLALQQDFDWLVHLPKESMLIVAAQQIWNFGKALQKKTSRNL